MSNKNITDCRGTNGKADFLNDPFMRIMEFHCNFQYENLFYNNKGKIIG